MTCVNIDFGTISNVIVQTVCAAKGLRTTNTFSCTATDIALPGGLSLIASLSCVGFDIKAFCSIVSQLSKCLKFMTFGRDVLSYAIECKYLSEALETFYQH